MIDQLTLAFPAPYIIENDRKYVFITYKVNSEEITFKGIVI